MQCKKIRYSLSWIILERLFKGTVNVFFQGIQSWFLDFFKQIVASASAHTALVKTTHTLSMCVSKWLLSYSSLLSPSVNPHRPRVAFTSVVEAAVLLSDKGPNVEKREDWTWSVISTMLSMFRRQYVLIKQPSVSLTLKYGNAQVFFCERKTQIWSMKQTDGD